MVPSDLEVGLRSNVVYLERLAKINSIKKHDSLSETCRALFKEMRERSILARSSDDVDRHRVTSAYNYIQSFIEAIERIDESEEEDEDEEQARA